MMCLSIRARLTDWGSVCTTLHPKRAMRMGGLCAYYGWMMKQRQQEGPCTALTPSLGFGFAGSISLVCLPFSDPLDLGKARSNPILGDEFLGDLQQV